MNPTNKESFSIRNETKKKPYIKGLFFEEIKRAVLKRRYALTLIFIRDDASAILNKTYRDKSGPTNVLSFSMDADYGEIFINTDAVEREYARVVGTKKQYIGYLYIHALFHLKGLHHGSTMEYEEKKIRTRFGLE